MSCRGLVLVADDEPDVRRLVRILLERSGLAVTEAANGEQALERLHESSPDVVVLDVTMPGLDGWHTLKRIRDSSDVPVLMLTARAAELDKVRGLRAGADDYVTKPFGRQELLARVEVLLRRARERAPAAERYDDGRLSIDFAGREVRVDGSDVALTPLEFRLLSVFVHHPGEVLDHDRVLALVWGDGGTVAPTQVKLYVGYLRRKLGWPAGVESPLETVRGFGYRYRPPDSPGAVRDPAPV